MRRWRNTSTSSSVIVVNRTRQRGGHEDQAATSGGTTKCAKVSAQAQAKAFDSEHPLFILYTSGSTGKPKGILHTSGGYLTGTYATCKYIFDMRDEDVYWCTADVGWITGHSYIVYGPLANGVTQVMYEGAPNHPDFGRFWKIIEELRRHHLLHRAHRHPRLHQGRRPVPRTPTISPRCACSARSASRSTRKPGSGITSTSAAADARSSIPGGRPKPAPS